MQRSALPAGFEEFALAQSPELFALARAMTGNVHDAWDLVQESLARMAERWGRSSFDSPDAYVRTVMARLNVDRFRRLRRELTPGRPVVHGDQELLVRDTPLSGWLVDALTTLSPRQRTAMALRFVDDLSVSEIADRMGCSEGTVKSQLSRGLERLREQLPAEYVRKGNLR